MHDRRRKANLVPRGVPFFEQKRSRVKAKEGNVLKEEIKADIGIFVEDKSENKKHADKYFQHQTAVFWFKLRQMLVDETKLIIT